MDNSPAPSMNYYRLSQTDYNGASKSFEIVAIDNFVLGYKPVRIINMLGEEVSEDCKGVIFMYYQNGTVVKKMYALLDNLK